MSKSTYNARYKHPTLTEALEPLSDLVKGVHPACESVASIGSRDFDSLVDSIKQYGLIRPIEVDREGMLVDGRCRVLACHVAGFEIADADVVETDVSPSAIAQSNNARRHLTLDQKTMLATRRLKEVRKHAVKKKSQGAKKGNKSRTASVGTDDVPTETGKQTRAPRSTEMVASQENVPRDRLAIAEKVKKADPCLAAQVEADEISLSEAAIKAGVKQAKRKHPTLRQIGNTASAIKKKPVPPAKSGTLFSDDLTSIRDDQHGIRIVKNRQCTSFTHLTLPLDAFVFAKQAKWVAASADGVGTKTWKTRKRAESYALSLVVEAMSESQAASASVV